MSLSFFFMPAFLFFSFTGSSLGGAAASIIVSSVMVVTPPCPLARPLLRVSSRVPSAHPPGPPLSLVV